MSASSEKKRRQEEKVLNAEKRAAEQREADAKAKKTQLKWRLGMGAIALFVIFSIVLNTSLPFRMTAVKVGDTAYSAAEMNYFYANSYYNYYQYMNMFGVDFSQPLKNQDCVLAESGSWFDYLVGQATDSVRSLEALYQEAVKDGYEISDEGIASVDAELAELPTYAEANGFGSVDKYLKAMYGTGVDEALIRDLMIKGTLVTEYTNSVVESYDYAEADLEAYYDEHKDEYETYDVLTYFIAAETEETTDVDGNTSTEVVEGGVEAALAEAEALAEGLTDRAGFEAAVAAYADGDLVTDASGYLKSNMNAAYRDWAADEAREIGDVTCVSTDSGAYVVMFMGMDDNHYNTTSMRHILIMTVDADEDGEYSEAEMAEAKAKVEELAAQWGASDKTEETFAAMANELSEDEGSNTNGGLYEGIGKGNMVTEIDEFLFADGRKVGDTAVVHGNNGGYDGYHLVLFVGKGDSYHLTLAENAKMNADYSAWEELVTTGLEVTTGMGYNLIGK